MNLVYSTPGSAGADLCSTEMCFLPPGGRECIGTGVFLKDFGDIPEGFCFMVLPRSGMAWKNGVTVLNSPGLIDRDYPGEIRVILINHGKDPFYIEEGMRIAQLVAIPYINIPGVPIKEIERTSGFGSTGV